MSRAKHQNIGSVELFAGIGGFRIACDNSNITTLWANDINESAYNVYSANFGSGEIVMGDINKMINSVPKHDLLTAGFPCQPFSSAGKKRGIQDPRGTLFEAIVKIIHKNQPKYFILENVKRLIEMDSGKHFATILSSLSNINNYQIEWRIINTMYFGLPQNRYRIFITGRKIGKEDEAGKQSYLLSESEAKTVDRIKDTFGKPQWIKISKHGRKFPSWGIAYKDSFFGKNLDSFSEAEKTKRISTIIQKQVPKSFVYNGDIDERLKNSVYINRIINETHVLYNQEGGARMGYTIFGTEGLAPTLTSSTSRHYERYKIGNTYRRLTNIEYARIQGFPDEHCGCVSINKQYKLYGNAVAPIMVEWVIDKVINTNGVTLG